MERQYKREKLNEHYQQMLQIENEQKKKYQWDYMNKPKIISKYQESSKFDAKYYESKKFLVEQKNKFSKLTSKAYIKQLSRHNLAKIQLAKIQAENGNTGPLDAKTQEALLKSNNIIQSDTKDIKSNSSAKRNFSAPKFRKDQNVSSFHMPKLGANQQHNGNTISGITVQSNNFANSTGINKNNQKRSSFGLRTEIKKGRSITSQAQFFNTNQKLSVI
ncbi:hypothetical protein PPERSA_07650 [Pseudocohnilembus persalinus]|uniref:Uncharacterized protein n=1 Tax=Pseudocohnilembus persalinus TaxID=266149 RepID=A0A0V0QIZ1_PSEPJ|nr:hypothetical protein PPERSA_07650 [Pseudocohnilembus persalinus]|eukprot:KRX02005.1 hypothetical protein PPERSA_07650 [Pseudocohnilembus persalinus]